MQGTHSSWQPKWGTSEEKESLKHTETTASYTSKLDLWPPSIKQYPFQHILTLSKDYTLSFHWTLDTDC